jgi:hypothetical protein
MSPSRPRTNGPQTLDTQASGPFVEGLRVRALTLAPIEERGGERDH